MRVRQVVRKVRVRSLYAIRVLRADVIARSTEGYVVLGSLSGRRWSRLKCVAMGGVGFWSLVEDLGIGAEEAASSSMRLSHTWPGG